jgi:hypothetical protein
MPRRIAEAESPPTGATHHPNGREISHDWFECWTNARRALRHADDSEPEQVWELIEAQHDLTDAEKCDRFRQWWGDHRA